MRKLVSQRAYIASKSLRGLTQEVRAQEAAGLTAVQTIERCLSILGIPEDEIESVIEAELLALPGWAGLFRELERTPALAPHLQLPCSLNDFLAFRLTLNAVGGARLAERQRLGPVATAWRKDIVERTLPPEKIRVAEAARLLDVAQLIGLSVGYPRFTGRPGECSAPGGNSRL